MSYENTAGLGVNNNYGPRRSGGTQGVERTAGAENEASVNFDGDALNFKVVVPAGAVVTDIVSDFATGAVSAATVGAVDISLAGQVDATVAGNTKPISVAVPLGGDLTITGPTAGSVIVKYLNVA